jgi:DNA-binding beta-propeller fold protein YncE
LGWVRDVGTDQKDIKIVLSSQSKDLTFSGIVLDPEAQPVPGVSIQIYGKEYDGKALIAQTKSNDEGRFVIEVTPSWAHFRNLTFVCVPRKGPITWKTVPYCSGSNLKLELKREVAISGKVVNKNGNGIVGAAVRFHRIGHPEYETLFATDEIVQSMPSAQTDEAGGFTLSKIPEGSMVSLYADHPEYGSEYAWNIWVSDQGTHTEAIELPDGITIEGLVRYAKTNRPAEGVRVEAEYAGSKPGGQAVTDSSGRYLIKGLEENPLGMYTIYAKGHSEPPEWQGRTVIDKKLKAGDSLSGVDVLVYRTLAARQREWLTGRIEGLKGNSWVAVLDDCDRVYNGKSAYEDTVTIYDGSGTSKGQFGSLNTCQTVGANHAVAYNHLDKSLWCAELVGDRLIKRKTNGTLVWEKKDLKPHALAIDPKTGNVWILTEEGIIYGKSLLVLSPSGEKISDWDIGAFDIGYSKYDDCFWLVGKKVLKLDRTGKIIYERPDKFAWLAVSVAVNNSDGSVWIVERRHEEATGSQNRVVILESDGRIRREIIVDRGYPMCIVVDSTRGFAWLATSEGVLKLTFDGKRIGDAPLRAFSVCVEPDTGYIWVAGRDGVYRLDSDGNPVWNKETPGGSQKWLCTIPN